VLYGHVGSAAINTRIKMMNRSKRIGVVVDSRTVRLSRLIFFPYGLGEVLMFTSVFSFLVSVVAGGLITVV
jgi:hypothetical protein